MKRLILLSFLVLACSDSQAPQVEVIPLLSIVAGDGQQDTVGRTLPVSIAARVTDRTSGAPLPDRVVNWFALDGGEVFAPVSQTGSDGIAKQTWTLGSAAGPQRLVARWINPETGEPITLDTAQATALADVAAIFEASVGPNPTPGAGNVFAVGDTILVEYRFLDAHRNPTIACADGGSPNRVAWTVSNTAAVSALGMVRMVGERRYAEFLAVETSPDPVFITGDPADVCTGANSVGVGVAVR